MGDGCQVFHYRAYELSFQSELECPEIAAADSASSVPDVVIRLGEVPQSLDDSLSCATYFQTAPREILLKITGVARYLVTGGREIVIDPQPGARQEDLRLFLLGSAMGALLYQRSLFPLHGSAIETPAGVMAFVGPSGIGKSTLAAHFQRRGYRLLSDDVCALTRDAAGRLRVLPAFPQQRLCADALERLGESALNRRLARFDEDKYVLPLVHGYCPQPVSLGAIYLLAVHELPDIVVKPVRGFARADRLISNLYRPEYLRGLDAGGNVLRLAAAIARNADIVEVAHDRDPDRIEELVDRLENEWRSSGADSLRKGISA